MQATRLVDRSRALLRVMFACCALAALVACSGGGDDGATNRPRSSNKSSGDPSVWPETPPPQGSLDKPWEVTSDLGESYLPNVFYAEDSENEQIMPVALDDKPLVDRLVYPTLGNPNLYVKSDPKDSLMFVMRVEPSLYAHLRWSERPLDGSPLRTLTFGSNDAKNGVFFYLISKRARASDGELDVPIASYDGKDVVRIVPARILRHPVPDDMPAAFRKRDTWRVIFDQTSMKNVPPGLYDARYEIHRDGALVASGGYEMQYNAVRVFSQPPAADAYSVINVTDTQVSLGTFGETVAEKTIGKLRDFVSMVNLSTDASVRNAAFITFNGDLHNGGTLGGLRSEAVASVYRDEARAAVQALKELELPIFLTPGNHDGYASTGHAPAAVDALERQFGPGLAEVVAGAHPKAWPDFAYDAFQGYLDATRDRPGGWHRDVWTGSFVRRAGASTFAEGFLPLARGDRNYVLYDGFQQWQRTFGPLYFSWTFGKNHYVSMNSFDLRQHRRTGWGMYTVNYGGGISPVQMEWIVRELDRADSLSRDTVVLAHHDPRGGHLNHDYPYAFEQLDYRGVGQSMWNYVAGHYVFPFACDRLPAWARPDLRTEDCLHDGLQEWMRPDEELDCDDEDRLPNGACDTARFDPKRPAGERRHPHHSNLELVDALLTHPRARTLLLGHTHYMAFEMLQPGDEVLPASMPADQMQAYASMEVQNPVRGLSWSTQPSSVDFDPQGLSQLTIDQRNARAAVHYADAAANAKRVLDGSGRELAILRTTSNADQTLQTYQGRTMLGFSVLHVEARDDARAYAAPQIDRVTMFVNAGGGRFDVVKDVSIDRTARVRMGDPKNPIDALFRMQW